MTPSFSKRVKTSSDVRNRYKICGVSSESQHICHILAWWCCDELLVPWSYRETVHTWICCYRPAQFNHRILPPLLHGIFLQVATTVTRGETNDLAQVVTPPVLKPVIIHGTMSLSQSHTQTHTYACMHEHPYTHTPHTHASATCFNPEVRSKQPNKWEFNERENQALNSLFTVEARMGISPVSRLGWGKAEREGRRVISSEGLHLVTGVCACGEGDAAFDNEGWIREC